MGRIVRRAFGAICIVLAFCPALELALFPHVSREHWKGEEFVLDEIWAVVSPVAAILGTSLLAFDLRRRGTRPPRD